MKWICAFGSPFLIWYIAESQSVTAAIVTLAAMAGAGFLAIDTILERYGRLIDKANGIEPE